MIFLSDSPKRSHSEKKLEIFKKKLAFLNSDSYSRQVLTFVKVPLQLPFNNGQGEMDEK